MALSPALPRYLTQIAVHDSASGAGAANPLLDLTSAIDRCGESEPFRDSIRSGRRSLSCGILVPGAIGGL